MASGRPDFSPTAVDVVLRPEWAAVESKDKQFYATAVNVASAGNVVLNYVVPVGKTLYITEYSFSISATNPAVDGEKNQMGEGLIFNTTTATTLIKIGGNGGFGFTLPKPLAISGETVTFIAYNASAHNVDLGVTALGYEV